MSNNEYTFDESIDMIVDEVIDEIVRAKTNVADDEFDKTNTKNDWIAYINAYIGRAADKVFRNEREGQEFRDNMVKAAGLCLSAIRAYDKGYMSND